MIEFISQPWPWYVGGPAIGFIMLILILFGEEFGMSSNLKTLCSISGAGKVAEFFRFEWKEKIWNLVVVVGAIIGGFIANEYLTTTQEINISDSTKVALSNLGFTNPGSAYVPSEIFGSEAITSVEGLLILIIGGILIGFGTRYANGCTSGHAISGLSNLQVPSLIAVMGFFIGGLITTFLIIPLIF